MPPIDVSTVLGFVQWAISEEPQVAASLKKIFSKPDPTAQDWQDERAAAAAMNYRSLVPNTDLPPEPPVTGGPAPQSPS